MYLHVHMKYIYIDLIESPDLRASKLWLVQSAWYQTITSMISIAICNKTRSLNPARNLIDGAGTNNPVVNILILTPPHKLTRLSEPLVNTCSHRALLRCIHVHTN